MSNKTIKVDEASKDEASKQEEAKTQTAPKAVKFPTVKLGTRTIRFREGVDRLQIDGEVHDTSELIKDKEVVQRLLRGNSPFIEIVKK